MDAQARRRVTGCVLATWLAVIGCALTGCSTTTAGRAEITVAQPNSSSSAATPSTLAPPPSGFPSAAPSNAVPSDPSGSFVLPTPAAAAPGLGPITAATNLVDRLESMPAGANDPAPTAASLTLSEWVKYAYLPTYEAQAQAELTAQGVVDIAHRGWSVPGGGAIDIALFRFATDAGAQSRFLYDSAPASDAPAQITFTVPGYPWTQVRGSLDSGLTGAGDASAQVVADLGSGHVAMEAFYFHPASVDKLELTTWITGQLLRLR